MPPFSGQYDSSNIDLSLAHKFLTHRIDIIKLAVVDTEYSGISNGAWS